MLVIQVTICLHGSRMVRYLALCLDTSINLLITGNQAFCDQIQNNLRILMTKSTLISGTSAKERNRFFHLMQDKIKALRAKIE